MPDFFDPIGSSRRLWREINLPCSLEDALSNLTKAQMDTIRKNLDLKNISHLKKAELAKEMARLMPSNYENIISFLDYDRYQLIKAIAVHPVGIDGDDVSDHRLESLIYQGYLFTGVYQGQKVLYLPQELKAVFQDIADHELERLTKKNTELILLTQGLLYYYGVLDVTYLIYHISELTGRDIDPHQYFNVIFRAGEFYEETFSSFPYLCHHLVEDVEEIVEQHLLRPELNFYPFTKEQLLEAGVPDYFHLTKELEAFLDFLQLHYSIDENETEEIGITLTGMVNQDYDPSEVMEFLNDWFEFPSLEFVQELMGKLIDVFNNTRQWILKGHTLGELAREHPANSPSSAKPRPKGKKAEVIDFRTRTKIGQDDPCPCGSGEKFNLCCGK